MVNEKPFHIGVRRGLFNKNLKEAMEAKGMSNHQLAKKIGVSCGTVSMIRNFRYKLTEEQKLNIAIALEVAIEDIFPEKYDELYDKISGVQREGSVEVDWLALEAPEVMAIEAPQNLEKETNDKMMVEDLTSCLNSKEKKIVLMRANGVTLKEVGKEFGVQSERIRQIEAKALEKMRQYGRDHKRECVGVDKYTGKKIYRWVEIGARKHQSKDLNW